MNENRRTSLILALAFIGLMPLLSVAQKPSTNVYRGIIVRNVEIEGRVLLPSEDRRDPERPAAHCRVRVLDQDEENILLEVITDEDGKYALPAFPPADYRLHIGYLRLNLRVEKRGPKESTDPRVLVVVVPKAMAYPRKPKEEPAEPKR